MADGAAPQVKPSQTVDGGLSKITAVRACAACRHRKIRCVPVVTTKSDSGEAVRTCKYCISLGRSECSFTDVKQPPRVRKSAGESSSESPRGSDDVEVLEERVRALEGMLEGMLAMQPQGGSEPGRASTSAQPFTPPASQEALWPRSREPQTDEKVVDSLAEDLESVHIANTSYLGDDGRLHMESTSYGLLPERYRPYATTQSHRFLAPSVVEQQMADAEGEMYKKAFYPLPPADLGRKLIDVYWDNFEPMLELLHRGYFDTCVSKGLLDTEPSFRRLYLVICAMGARNAQDPRLRPYKNDYSWGWEFFELAAIPLHILRPTLFDVQADALSAFYTLGNSTWTSVWHVTRDATRKVIDAGIYREDTPYWKASLLRDQLRKKAFYLLYGLDRITSSALGRPLALHDGDFDVQPPLDISEAQLTALAVKHHDARADGSPAPEITHPTTAGRLIMEIMRLDSATIKFVQQIKTLDQETIRNTLSDINAGLDRAEAIQSMGSNLLWKPQDSDEVLVQTFLTVALLKTTRILLHKHLFSSPPPMDGAQSPLSIAASSARSIAHLTEALVDRNLMSTTAWFGSTLCHTAGLVLAIAAASFVESRSASDELLRSTVQDVERCLRGLKGWSQFSFIGNQYHESLLHHYAHLQSKLRKHRADDDTSTSNAPPSKRAQPAATSTAAAASSYPSPPITSSSPVAQPLSASTSQLGYDPFAGQQVGANVESLIGMAPPVPDLSSFFADTSLAGSSSSYPAATTAAATDAFPYGQPFPSFMATPATDPFLGMPDLGGFSTFTPTTQDYESAMFDLTLLNNYDWNWQPPPPQQP